MDKKPANDRWLREQYKKKHLRRSKVSEEISALEGKVKKVQERFEAKFQERVKPLVEEQKAVGEKIEAVAKTFREKLNATVKEDLGKLNELRAESAKLEKHLLSLSAATLADVELPEDIEEEPAIDLPPESEPPAMEDEDLEGL